MKLYTLTIHEDGEEPRLVSINLAKVVIIAPKGNGSDIYIDDMILYTPMEHLTLVADILKRTT